MRNWSNRTREIAYLLNPAFCSRLLYATIKEYEKKTTHSFPFPLVYLILPLVLHKETREAINSRTQLPQWVQLNQRLMIGLGRRTKDLVPITNEALEFLLQSKMVHLSDDGTLTAPSKRGLSKTRFVNSEITECIIKCEHVARWFANTGKIETIYICLGVRP